MPPVLALGLTPTSSNYPYLENIFMVPQVFEPLKFYCSMAYYYNGPFDKPQMIPVFLSLKANRIYRRISMTRTHLGP